MVDRAAFEVQGHRGARGLRPENTLSGFELALDLGVSTIETDVHLTRDGAPVLSHDPTLHGVTCPQSPTPVYICQLTLAQLRLYPVDPARDQGLFTDQTADVGPLTRAFADTRGMDPFCIPMLAEL